MILQSSGVSLTESVDLIFHPRNSELLVDGSILVIGMGVGDYSQASVLELLDLPSV